MTQALADAHDAIELRPGYSGRGMFGASTFAVVYPNQGVLMEAVAHAALDANRAVAGAFAEEVRGLRFDNMGLDYVAY